MNSVHAVVVTFHPSPEAAAGIQAALAQAQHVIVVDNGSTDAELTAIGDGRLEVVRNGSNLGVAEAQNIGIRRAMQLGASHVLLLDQDSVAEPGMVEALLGAAADTTVGIAAPVTHDTDQKKPARFLTSPDGRKRVVRELDGPILDGLLYAIASGSLVPAGVFRAVGLMRDDFFIDFVDVEFGLRVRRAGLRIVAVRDARLRHRLGNYEERRLFGRIIPVTHHSAARRYTQYRNRWRTLRLHGCALPAFRRSEWTAMAVDAIRLAFFERHRPSKMWATFRGTLAGIFGRLRRQS